jgi:hypothetical protein
MIKERRELGKEGWGWECLTRPRGQTSESWACRGGSGAGLPVFAGDLLCSSRGGGRKAEERRAACRREVKSSKTPFTTLEWDTHSLVQRG